MKSETVTGVTAMLKAKIRNCPSPVGMSKQEILNLLLQEEYGVLPSAPESVTGKILKTDRCFYAGKADLYTVRLDCKASWGCFSFPVYYTYPKRQTSPYPCLIHVNFRDSLPDRYQPTEELLDAGYAVMTFCYQDVSTDDGDFTNGLAGKVYPNGNRAGNQCGKIGLWAWAAGAVLQYALTLPEINSARISVIGHSRLGKTALLAGALNEEFFCAISNDSGCSGAALSRGKKGETVAKIKETFGFWFCENYRKYAGHEDLLPFDQHYLIAANAPHKVYVASGSEDAWADPENEYLACVAASEYYESLGLKGFSHPDRLPGINEAFHGGNIGYHLRDGAHTLSRYDWNQVIRFLEQFN